MPFALARYWDSLESADYLDEKIPTEINEIDEPSLEILQKENVDICHQQWLSELSLATEHECHSILYAKSLLGDATLNASYDCDHKTDKAATVNTQHKEQKDLKNSPPPRKSSNSSIRSRSQSESTSVPSIPPPKPQRRIARKKNDKVEVSKNDKWAATYSTLDLIESCKFTESHYASIDGWRQGNQTQSTLALNSSDRTTNNTAPWTPPGLRFRRDDSSLPQLNCSITSSTSTINRRPQPPTYEQLSIRVEKTGNSKVVGRKPIVINRQTVAVSSEDVEKARRLCNEAVSADSHNRNNCMIPPASPKSMNSDSTLSVDSGQCSGDLALNSFSSSREEKDVVDPCQISTYQSYQQRCLPSYPRMASTMDHVLRTASSIYTLFSQTCDHSVLKDLSTKSTMFIQILESSPCVYYLPKSDISAVKSQISELQRSPIDEMSSSLGQSNYFVIIVRKMVEQVLQLFAKIISKHINECGNKDRLLVIALEHLIHIILFGDELCLETIQVGGLTSLLKLIRTPGTPSDTCRLLLRAMAVLCGVSKGCLSLLSFGGLDIVLHHLGSTSSSCAIEASGVLTQLTNPQHSFIHLHNVENILARLLDLVDICSNGESLLLVSAALANVTLQDQGAVDMLYRLNAISRLIQGYNRQYCSTIFVQEQLVTTFSRLAARRYEEALIAQGAIPVLLEMLTVTDKTHTDYCRRIRYKAAVCIGTLAATGIGLKALYNHQGYAILCHVLEMESSTANPLNMICTSIRNKLEGKYRIESAV
ncbi:unnamed protein product [Auanema sp. JU1783]|nr:unnamed protein product [Auanema sp. JU1783]